MKKLHSILLAAVVLAGFASTASAKIEALPRMKWVRGISSYGAGVTDSTRISIPGAGASVDMTDTTEWLDLNNFNMANQAYTGQNLLWFHVTKQAPASTDSVGYQIQYTNDLDAGATGFTATTLAYVTSVASQDALPLIPAIAPAATLTTAPLARYVRLIIQNSDVSAVAAGRLYFSARPVILKD